MHLISMNRHVLIVFGFNKLQLHAILLTELIVETAASVYSKSVNTSKSINGFSCLLEQELVFKSIPYHQHREIYFFEVHHT